MADEQPKDFVFKKVYRITTFVPPDRAYGVLKAVCLIDPLAVGKYNEVAWYSCGIEQYLPRPGAHPVKGQVDCLSMEPSVQLVFSIDRDPERLSQLLESGLFKAHPWETPVVFVDESVRVERTKVCE